MTFYTAEWVDLMEAQLTLLADVANGNDGEVSLGSVLYEWTFP